MLKLKSITDNTFQLSDIQGIKLLKNNDGTVFLAVNEPLESSSFQLYKADGNGGWGLIYQDWGVLFSFPGLQYKLQEDRTCFDDPLHGNLVFLLTRFSRGSTNEANIVVVNYDGDLLLCIPCPPGSWLERFPCGDFMVFGNKRLPDAELSIDIVTYIQKDGFTRWSHEVPQKMGWRNDEGFMPYPQ